MSQLTVYKASAGSGKTYRLTVEYLKFLIQRPDSYRNILAVTFTNKATGEMKGRILDALYKMMHIDVSAKPSGMVETLCRELGVSPYVVRERSTLAMNMLLHDYGRFHVETIDSFFQTLLRNLARELGIGTSLNIELNDDSVLEEAIASMIDKSAEDEDLLKWISDYMEEQYGEGKSWKIDIALNKFGKNIFSESFREKSASLKDKLKDKKFLSSYKKELQTLEAKAKANLNSAAENFFNLISQHGLDISDFTHKESGPCSYFLNLKKDNFDNSITTNSYLQDALNDPEKWCAKSHRRRNEIIELASAELIPMYEKTEKLRKELAPLIMTCRLVTKHLNEIGLLNDISEEVINLNHGKNRFLLSETSILLHSLISGQDASFVYEKTGVEINHVLFDEFQDTSRMQWETFRPLMTEGLANGNKSLIVGDEKQSIYRWRNSDWRILGNISGEMKPVTVDENVLPKNWRSEKRIVDFNNDLFSKMATEVSNNYSERFGMESPEVRIAYKDVRQESSNKEPAGMIEIRFLPSDNKEEYKKAVLQKLIEKTEDLQRKGIKADQIAILIRFNKFIPEIASVFAEYKKLHTDNGICYDIVSDEAFLLSSSNSLQILTGAMRLLADPENKLLEAQLKLDYQIELEGENCNPDDILRNDDDCQSLPTQYINRFETLRQMPVYELAEELYRVFGLNRISGQDSFMHAFMDGLSEYLERNSSDLVSFLSHWDEKLSTKSIPAGTGINGIRIMSIHKAKGLEFDNVLIPFCDWEMAGEQAGLIWCGPEKEPFSKLDLIPVDFSKSTDESFFKLEYEEETIQRHVDNLNLLYVAFTRAKNNLFAFCKKPKVPKKGNDSLKLISDLIYKSLPDDNFTKSPEEEEDFYEKGEFCLPKEIPVEKKEEVMLEKGEDITVPFLSLENRTKFRQSDRSREFSRGRDPEGFSSSYIDRGKLLHKLFSDINTKDDIDKAIQNLVSEGLANSEEAEHIRNFTENSLAMPEVSDWYSGKYRLFNECSILCKGSDGHTEMKRPDRVMISDDEVKIVDFKFGRPSAKYKYQILEYIRLLKAMENKSVNGYLWYVDDGKIEEITD